MSAPPRFRFTVEPESPGPVQVVALFGQLDPLAADDLLAQMNKLVDAGERRFVFDLRGLEYVGSLGLRVFVGLAGRVRGDGAVCLFGPTRNVWTAFEATKLNKLLTFYPSRHDAVDGARR